LTTRYSVSVCGKCDTKKTQCTVHNTQTYRDHTRSHRQETHTNTLELYQGRSKRGGGIWVYISPKSVQLDFYGVKLTSEQLLNMSIKFYTSQKILYPPKQISGYTPELYWIPAPANPESGHFFGNPAKSVSGQISSWMRLMLVQLQHVQLITDKTTADDLSSGVFSTLNL